ncbi:MAG TPA: CBS domain-containing protein, partial [Nitrospira sp.]|nr:CBS domain-containing protein [Nitrospira sp.]
VPEYHPSPDDTFENAVLLFDQHAVEFLYVLDNEGILQGVITRNELFEAFAQGKKPSTKVRDFMRNDPIAVTSKDTSLMASDLMNKHDIDRLPVVESKDNRRLIGLVRSEKMLRWLVEQSHVDPPGS